MRRLVPLSVPLLSLVLFLIVPLGASASQSAGNGPKLDKVDGTLYDMGPTALHVNAYSDPGGANPGGHFWYRSQQTGFESDIVGDVTCVNVFAPDRAWVGGRIDRSKMPGFPGEGNGVLFLIVDTGEPADANPLMPDSHADFYYLTPPTICPTGGVYYFPYKSGNFVVQQATP
jgi:hypothetical protein